MPKGSVVGSLREEVPVAASARETGDKWDQRKVPPLAEASCGAISTRIATATTQATLWPLNENLPDGSIHDDSLDYKRPELEIRALIKINCFWHKADIPTVPFHVRFRG